MTKTAKCYFENPTHNFFTLRFCCDGLHVYEKWHFMWGLQEQTVTLCDKSCENQPVINQKEFSEEDVAAFRKLLKT